MERTVIQDTEVYGGSWNASTTCVLSYANFCTGFIFNWTGWVPGERIGQVFHPSDCCGPGVTSGFLTQTIHRQRVNTSPGWGFTGSADIWAADAQDCPTGVPLDSQPWLPTTYPPGSGFQVLLWGVSVPANAMITFTFDSPHPSVPALSGFDSDLGGVGHPSNPQLSCDFCFACPRPNHSYYYGVAPANLLCPGSGGPGSELDPQPVDTDGAAVEWRIQYFMTCPVGVETENWGSIKSLYR